ncbi:SERTA domain-containing protein 2-like [Gastrophryne carolinensis]
MPTRGIKRKFPEWEESVLDGQLSFQADGYYFFRQSLLNMSLEKFNKGRMMVEPSLRRYVLIANTLRVIQDDMRQEGPCIPPALDGGLPVTYDPSAGNVVGPLPPDLENILLPSMEDDFSVSTAIATILKELESVLDESCPQRPFIMPDPEAKLESINQAGFRVPLATQSPSSVVGTIKGSLGEVREIELIKELVLATACTEILPAPSPVTPPESPSPMDTSNQESVTVKASPTPQESQVDIDTSKPEPKNSDHPKRNSAPVVPAEELKPSEAVFGSFEIMNSSYLNDVSFDDPFSDIDTSVFERESPSIGSNARLSASEELWFPSTCNSPSYSSNQGMREPNDLDNIIEILVGS